MLTAHLPSGYVLGKTLKQHWNIPYLLPVALLGAVLPDFDTIWFLFIDQGAIHYNRYWVHIPPVLGEGGTCGSARNGGGRARVSGHGLRILCSPPDASAAGYGQRRHSVGRVVQWSSVQPGDRARANHSHWVLSFLLHWGFMPELLIWAWAFWLWCRPCGRGPSPCFPLPQWTCRGLMPLL